VEYRTVSMDMNGDLDLSPSQISILADKTTKGDGDAAWRLFECYNMARSDEKNGDLWLRRAAELQNVNAERFLAILIRNGNHSPGIFGATGPEAFHKLLEQASRTDGSACYDLASAYEEGYPDLPDFAKARFYYTKGSELGDDLCWIKLSQYCDRGVGGPRDEASAYYWISLETRCVHPLSIAGKEEWAKREAIAKNLSLDELKKQWDRVDNYISQVRAGKISVDFPPFGKGLYHPDSSKEGMKLSDEWEAKHRRQLEQRG
jgi:hypothetical protein